MSGTIQKLNFIVQIKIKPFISFRCYRNCQFVITKQRRSPVIQFPKPLSWCLFVCCLKANSFIVGRMFFPTFFVLCKDDIQYSIVYTMYLFVLLCLEFELCYCVTLKRSSRRAYSTSGCGEHISNSHSWVVREPVLKLWILSNVALHLQYVGQRFTLYAKPINNHIWD